MIAQQHANGSRATSPYATVMDVADLGKAIGENQIVIARLEREHEEESAALWARVTELEAQVKMLANIVRHSIEEEWDVRLAG